MARRKPWPEAGRARSSPTALTLAGPLCLHGCLIPALSIGGGEQYVTWLRARNLIVCPSQQSWQTGRGRWGAPHHAVKRTEAQEGKWRARERGRVQSEARTPGLGLGQWVASGPWCPQGLNMEGNSYHKRLMLGLWQLRALTRGSW